MPYLIDGHNLIPKIPEIQLDDLDDEERLIQILQSYSRERRKKIEVFFDKAPPGQARTLNVGNVTAHFIPESQTADQAILRRLQKLGKSAHNWTIVTSDRQVQAAAREMRAQVVSSEDFSEELSQNPAFNRTDPKKNPDTALSEEEVDHWLEIFQRGRQDD